MFFSASDPDVLEATTTDPDVRGAHNQLQFSIYIFAGLELPPSHGLSPAEERFLVKAARSVGVRFAAPAHKTTVQPVVDDHRDQVDYMPHLPKVSSFLYTATIGDN